MIPKEYDAYIAATVKCSKATLTKQKRLHQILSLMRDIWASVQARHRWIDDTFHFIDLHAGAGWHPEYGAGSTRIAIDVLHKRRAHITSVEIDPELCYLLSRYTQPNGHLFTVENADNRRILRSLARTNTRKSLAGVVYADPHGVRDMPFDELVMFAHGRKTRTVDILMNVPANTLVRSRICPKTGDWPYLHEVMQRMNKKRWLVTDREGPTGWCFVLGTNHTRMGDWKKAGFYRVDTPEGSEVLRRLSYSKKEIIAQGELFS